MTKRQEESAIARRILLAVQKRYGMECLAWINRTGMGLSMDGARPIPFGFPGSPDILACIRGRFVGIEVKTKTGKQEKTQAQFQREFERAGGLYILARSPGDAILSLEKAGLT